MRHCETCGADLMNCKGHERMTKESPCHAPVTAYCVLPWGHRGPCSSVALNEVSRLRNALSEIASRTDWTRDEAAKFANDAVCGEPVEPEDEAKIVREGDCPKCLRHWTLTAPQGIVASVLAVYCQCGHVIQ